MSTTITAQVETITPEMALAWLTTSRDHQRSIAKSVVAKYSRDLLAGRFVLNGESIVFDRLGALLDGQHRLLACVATGISFQSVVVRGVDAKALPTINSGKPRDAGDVMKMVVGDTAQWAARKAFASIALLLSTDGAPNHRTRTSMSRTELVAALETYRPALDWLSQFPKSRVTTAPVLAAVASAWLNGMPEQRCAEFVAALTTATVACPSTDDAALLLRSAIAGGRLSSGGRAQRGELYLKTQRALRAFLDHKVVDKLYQPLSPIWKTAHLFQSVAGRRAA